MRTDDVMEEGIASVWQLIEAVNGTVPATNKGVKSF